MDDPNMNAFEEQFKTEECTWLDCGGIAEFPQVGENGVNWANLCGIHNKKLSDSLASGNVKIILGTWVRASGGAKKMAESM